MRALPLIALGVVSPVHGQATLSAPNQPVLAYPERPIRIVVPFAAGGLVDASIRAIGPKMSEALGQPVIIDNKGGAGGLLGASEVSRSAPDGYTLLFSNESTLISPYIYKGTKLDALKDLQPISELLAVPLVILIHSSIPVNSLNELATYSRAHAGTLSAGTGGTGTAAHLCLETFRSMSHADILHVPYKGAGPALTDFLAGQTQVFSVSTTLSLAPIRTGKAKALAVAAARRAPRMPDVPTTAEAGYPGLEFSLWMGLFGPAHMRPEIVERIRAVAIDALSSPEASKRFADQGLDSLGSMPVEFARFLAIESAKYRKAVDVAGIQPD